MRAAARLRGAQVNKSDGQFKMANQEEYNGEIKTIMNLLKSGGPGGPTVIQKPQLQALARLVPHKPSDGSTKRSTSVPTMLPATRNSTARGSFEEDINVDDEEEIDARRASIDSDILFNFKSNVPSTNMDAADQADMINGLKGDIISLQHALQSERNRTLKEKNVAGSQFRIGKPETRCENCAEMNLGLKKSKEIIRSLKLQLSRLEDKYAGLRKSRQPGDETPTQSDSEERDLLQKRYDECELEIGRLRKNAKTDQYTIESLQKMLLEWQLKEEANKSEIGNLKDKNHTLHETNDDQRRAIDKLKMELGQFKLQLEAAELKLNRPKNSDVEKEKELLIVGLKQRLQEADSERDALLAQIAMMQKDLDDSNRKLGAAEASRLAAKRAEQDAILARDEVLKKADVLEKSNKKLAEDGVLSEKERAKLTAELHAEKGKFVELANENVTLMQDIARLRDMLKNFDDKADQTQHALEKAIAQSVRLCVVAPTVNVHVSDKKMKFKGGLQDGKLKDFLDTEILEKYSIMFKQKEEGSSPDGSTSIQGWLQKLLAEMQKSIETHVNNAMAGDS